MRKLSKSSAAAAVLAAGTVLYGAKAAALFDIGGDAVLANLLANATKQLAVATQSLSELRRSYGQVKKVADFAEDAASGSRSFQRFSNERFGGRFLSDLGAARPDLERFRSDALQGAGMSGSEWAKGTGTMRRLSTYCLGAGATTGPDCVQLRDRLESSKVLAALSATFGRTGKGGAAETGAVDAEVSAAIQGDATQERVASMKEMRVRELLRRCNSAGDGATSREARRVAGECRAAAEQAQLLHLEEGQETNAKLAQLARLQAVGVAQKNADLKRGLAEQAARRAALTAGLEDLAAQRVGIKGGGLGF